MSRLAPPLHLRNETELERCDRHLAELMQEVRVAQTGVQVLFGFLLTVPFTVGFDALTPGERRLFFITLAMAGAAAMLLITPTAHHRILFRCGDKPNLVRLANRYALAGLVCVALAMVGALGFVSAVVFDSGFAALAAAIAAAACAWCWYGQPLLRRRALHAQLERADAAADLGGTTVDPALQRLRPRVTTRSAVDASQQQRTRFTRG
jgi:hypothetical protein